VRGGVPGVTTSVVGVTVGEGNAVAAWVVESGRYILVGEGSGVTGTVPLEIGMGVMDGLVVPHKFVPQAERSIPVRMRLMAVLRMTEFIGQIIPP